jgi:hypothetical protein
VLVRLYLLPDMSLLELAAGSPEREFLSGEAEIAHPEGGQTMRYQVEIAVDGSCLGNPGPGGWACILASRSECSMDVFHRRRTIAWK